MSVCVCVAMPLRFCVRTCWTCCPGVSVPVSVPVHVPCPYPSPYPTASVSTYVSAFCRCKPEANRSSLCSFMNETLLDSESAPKTDIPFSVSLARVNTGETVTGALAVSP